MFPQIIKKTETKEPIANCLSMLHTNADALSNHEQLGGLN